MLLLFILFISIISYGHTVAATLFHLTSNGTYELTETGRALDTKLSKLASVLPAYNILKKNFLQKSSYIGNITSPCVRETIQLLLEVNNQSEFTGVTSSRFVRMLDAWAKPPERIFLGNSMWIGAYDECVDFQDAKYCSTPITIQKNPLDGQYGSCFPKQCTTGDVSKVISVVVEELTSGLVKVDQNDETLCKSSVEYSTGVIVSAALLAFILLLCLVGTAADVLQTYFSPDDVDSDLHPRVTSKKVNKEGIENNEPDKHDPRVRTSTRVSFEQENITRSRYSDEVGGSAGGDEAFVISNSPVVKELMYEKGPNESASVTQGDATNGNAQVMQNPNVLDIDLTDDTSKVKTKRQTSSVSSLVDSEPKQKVKKNVFKELLICFSLLRNSEAILSTDIPPGAIKSINGIRVISMTWVIIGHFYQHNVMGGKPDNISGVRKSSHRFSLQPILNAFVCVDTFFLISGLLVTFISLRKVGKRGFTWFSVLMMYVHRFVRLTPSLAVVIIFWTNLYPALLSGPRSFLVTQTDSHAEKCWNYWWSVVFYFNNFYPDHSEGCLEWSWYLANDTQFYVISPAILSLIIAIQRKYSKTGYKTTSMTFLFLLLLCLVSVIITGIITGYFDIPGLVSRNMISSTPRSDQAKWIVDRLYIKPYVRVTPFLVGIFLGYLLHNKIILTGPKGQWMAIFGWSISITLALLVVVGPWEVYREKPNFFSDIENVMYSATHRFLWSCSVAWLIYACHNNYGGYINKFLSSKVWLPLSRLTYGAYLVHMIVMYYLLNAQEISNHYQNSLVITRIISIIVITHCVAFVLAVCVEYPILNLEKIIFGK